MKTVAAQSEFTRRAKLSVGLLVVLAILVLASAAYWLLDAQSAPKLAINPAAAPAEFTLKCEACGKVAKLTLEETDKIPEREGYAECPSCKKFKGVIARSGGGSVLPPGGG
ncbi:MAG: hypothetical protein CHACPFDD_00427 [Phycisphaerae bacterium]|nr:hypothetical protein [Phycisphaerae bacterium]